ncbi:AAA family ATPase [Bradyrhizobium sp. ORS 375]|uniref:ATP-binding protein n=1 Tax=Bradyrhizobium sp. (strain ORS 375) TaxID=566679 RepID=UPI001FCA4F04|nr:AAA family ATPase [Bradyrhizobium sp. ORS 375]
MLAQDWDHMTAPVRLPANLARRILDTRTLIEGEKKQITVLFADIRGSTALIDGLDPEDADQFLRRPIEAMVRAVHRYGGTINRIQGDGIMALFGAPLAHEDSPVRAAYAALDMQKDVREICGSQILLRVGLHTGDVLVRAIHNDLSVNYDAIGPTVHLAARMEQMASPGTIYCTDDIMRLASGFIDARPLGLLPVKGVHQPVQVHQIAGRTGARTRWDVSAARQLSPFVGRRLELAELQRAFERAQAGGGQAIAVRGQPGSGKSRLVHEFMAGAEPSDWTVLKIAAVEFQRGTPFLAIGNMLRAWCEIAEDASPADAEQRLRVRLASLPSGASVSLPALRALLNLPAPDGDWSALDPAVRRSKMIESVNQLLLCLAETNGLLLWVDDLQWADAESRNVLDSLIDRIGASRVLLIMTFRPEHEHKWSGSPKLPEVTLDRLAPAAAEKLFEALVGDGKAALRTLVVERTDGIPLFLEEAVRALLDNGSLQLGAQGYELTRDVREIQIPRSVQSVIATRIDHLPPERKALLQVAAVIGSEINIPLLTSVMGANENELNETLLDLKIGQFLSETPNTRSLIFKHALIHDVAYHSMVGARRRSLHADVLRALKALDRDEVHMASLAHHALHALRWEDALGYLCRAGDKAMDLSAYRDARAFFDSALQALTHLPQDRDHICKGIDIRLKLRQVFGATGDYETLDQYLTEAELSAIAINDRGRLASINVARSFVYNFRGELDATIQCGLRACSIAREIGDPAIALSASFFLGQAYMWRGQFREAVALLADNLSWIDGPLRHQRSGTTGTGSVLWLGMLGASQARLGNFPAGIAATEKACLIADEVQRPADLVLAYWWAGFVRSHQGDIGPALEHLERSLEICKASQIDYLVPVVLTSLGYAYALAGRGAEGIALLARAEMYTRSAKFAYGEAWSSVYLGFARLMHGTNADIRAEAENVLELTRKHKYRAIEADALRLLAQVHQSSSSPSDLELASSYYNQASEICDELGLEPEHARCEIGLGQLRLLSDERAEAEALFDSAERRCRGMGMRLPDCSLERFAGLNRT